MNPALTELFKAGTGFQEDVANVVDGPGVQLAEGHFQKHAVKGRDQIDVLQTVEQRLPAKEGCNEETLTQQHSKKQSPL